MRGYPLENNCVICNEIYHADDSFSLNGENWHCSGCVYKCAKEKGIDFMEYLKKYVWMEDNQ